MRNETRMTVTAGARGCVTVSLKVSISVRAMYAPKPLRQATLQTPNQLRMKPIEWTHPKRPAFLRIRQKAFQAAWQKKVFERAT